MKKLITLLLVLTGMVTTASATTLHIGMEKAHSTSGVYVFRNGGSNPDDWNSMGDAQKATLEGDLYGRRWYSIDMNGNNQAQVRFDDWYSQSVEITGISGDDYYIYVSTTVNRTYEQDGTRTVYNAGQLSSKGWDTMKFSNDVDGKWDDSANECTKVDDNTFTYTLTKAQIGNKATIYFRFKLANGVFFVNNSNWSDHYFRIGATSANTSIGFASPISQTNYSTDKEYNWVLTVPTYDFEKIVFKIVDTSNGATFDGTNWTVSADAYITKTVSGTNKYATFGCSVPLEIIEYDDVTAYPLTANATTGKITKGTAFTTIPANQGALLENATSSDKTIRAKVLASADASAANDLVAFTGSGRLTQPGGNTTYYILGKQDDHVGFYSVNASDGNAMGANTAYLVVTGTGARSFYSLDDEENVTAIDAVKQSANTNGDYFNIAGQRVAQPTKGLYIVNGKKVIIK